MNKKDYQDVITRPSEVLMIIDDEERRAYFSDPNYHPVLVALRDKPLTVIELETEYNKIIEDKIDKMGFDPKNKADQQQIEKLRKQLERKEKTLYRYLDKLEKVGLVIQTGKRIKMGQTATQTLFGRSAKLFLTKGKDTDWCTNKTSIKTLSNVAKLISSLKGIPEPSVDCLGELMNKLDQCYTEEIIEFYRNKGDEVYEIIKDSSFKEADKILHILNTLLIILNSEGYLKKLNSCI